MSLSAQAESVLTPEFARKLVRIAGLRTGSALYDDDIVQDALLRGLIAFRRNVDVRHPKTFFFMIVRNVVRDRWRRRQNFTPLQSGLQWGYVVDFEGALDRRRRLEQIRHAFGRLSPEQHTLMRMFYEEGLRIGEIAAIRHKSRSALKMALLRGRKAIINAVKGHASAHHDLKTPGRVE